MYGRRCKQCGEMFQTRRRASYCSSACRTAAWKERSGYVDQRKREASRNGKPKRHRKPEVRLTYDRAVQAAAEAVWSHAATRMGGDTKTTVQEIAARVVGEQLSERQRQIVNQREERAA